MLAAWPCSAGGFLTPGQSPAALALPAFTAQGADPSVMFLNPAGIGMLTDKTAFVLGGNVRVRSLDFKGAPPFPGSTTNDKGDPAFLFPPLLAITQPVKGSVVLGLGFSMPAGLNTKWSEPNAFAGRFLTQQAGFSCYSIAPTVALRLADRLAIGLGGDVQIATLSLDKRVAMINPFSQKLIDAVQLHAGGDTALAWGGSIGLLAKPQPNFSIGLSYRLGTQLDFAGLASLEKQMTNNSDIDRLVDLTWPLANTSYTSSVKMPAILSAGVLYAWNDWGLAADIRQQSFSTLEEWAVDFPLRPELKTVLARDYKNAVELRLGLERRINHIWTMRMGYAYGTSPAPASSLVPGFYDANRHDVSLGAIWRRGSWRMDMAGGFVFLGERATGDANPEGFNGSYKSFEAVAGLSLGYGF
ncbi:MAG: outer membrane protein transport protein [Vicinamibacteria bacterium]|nr:outer membrane protein transport protein [Vicinamibacteria bacterium]